MNRHIISFLVILLLSITIAISQDNSSYKTPRFAIKSNLLYDVATNINLGVEIKASEKITFDIPFNYNPWTFNDNKKFKTIFAQPEIKFWFCEAFSGSSIGLNIIGGAFNTGGIDFNVKALSEFKEHRFEGFMYGGGLSYNYHFILDKRWSMEAGLGLGIVRFEYDKFNCKTCGKKIKSGNYDYIGPTKAGLSIIYHLK